MRWAEGVLIAGGAACVVALAQGPRVPATAPAFAGRDLAVLPTTGWLTNGGDWFNRRFSPLTQINRDNVAGLKPVWRTHLNGSGIGTRYSGEAQPIVHEGVAYIITGADDVFAISLASGEILWTYTANPTNPST
jgi:glucose dehydrogenase